MERLLPPALLLIDIQADFIHHPGLTPEAATLLPNIHALLTLWREASRPVIHIHTEVAADGHDAMPHWREAGVERCRAGSQGVLAAEGCAPLPHELRLTKRFFSAFGPGTGLDTVLHQQGIRTVIIAGLYTHACVRAAVLDAYERGFEVWVAADAVASPEPLQAELSRRYLSERACSFLTLSQIRDRLAHRKELERETDLFPHHAPASGELMYQSFFAHPICLDKILLRLHEAQRHWQATPPAERANVLRRWQALLLAGKRELLNGMVEEIGKPISDAEEEFGRAMAHLRTAIAFAERPNERVADVWVRHRPLGCIGIITPWNNPIAIAVSKIAAALAFGNVVVWKPSEQTMRTSSRIFDAFLTANPRADLVIQVMGGAKLGVALMRHPGVDAVTLTGSMTTGRIAAACCQAEGKPLQAELGGNNAAIVWFGADLFDTSAKLARAAFGFAGQRCTALRRIIVQRALFDAFTSAFLDAVAQLPAGDLMSPSTVQSPLISAQRLARMKAIVAEARAEGAQCLCGGQPSKAWPSGNGFEPTVLQVEAHHRVFQEESFGPIAVLIPADDLDAALKLANAVPHGLLAAFFGGNGEEEAFFIAHIQAGMLRLGHANLHPDAPFVGWKASAIGPPEHGRWDREFYARPQTLTLPPLS